MNPLMNKAIAGIFICLICLVALTPNINAQSGLSYGFKAGLNRSWINGPVDAEETYKSSSGFHIGIIFKYPLTDLFGLKGEFVYTQKGGTYEYDGPSPFLIQSLTNPTLVTGHRKMGIDVSNNYLEFPLLAYGKFGIFELSAGVNLSILAGSLGAGKLTYTVQEPTSAEFDISLDYRFYKDKPGEFSSRTYTDFELLKETAQIPTQVGAFYEFAEKEGSTFVPFEFGLLAGVSIYLNDGLYLGIRGNYGLTDVTRGSVDATYQTFTNNQPTIRNDNDKQISYQVSLGFSF